MLETLFFVLVAVAVGLPVIVIATENSGKRADRKTYIVILLIWVLATIAAQFSLAFQVPRLLVLIEALILLALSVWVFRVTVQRVRDMGKPKTLAYVAAIPLVGLLFQLYLTFPASSSDANDH